LAWLETGLVYVICGLAAAYLARTVYRIFKPAKDASGCDKCEHC